MQKSPILLTFLIATLIYSISLWFTVSGIFLFFTSLFLLIGSVFFSKKFKFKKEISYPTLLSTVLVLFTILSFTLEATDVNGLQSLAMWLGRLLMFLATIISLFYFLEFKNMKIFKFIASHKFIILILLSFFIQLSLLRILKTPEVDIYNITKYGPLSLLEGKNPYLSEGINSSFHYDYYTYGPASIFLFLPFDLLLRDPRYLLVACNFLTAFALYKISKLSLHQKNVSEMLALIYLYHPRYPNLLNSASTDVLVVGLLSFALLGFVYKRFYQFGVGLGLLVGVKILFAAPLIFLLKDKQNFTFSLNNKNLRKTILAGLITLSIFYLPFLISNANAIISSSLLFFYTQKEIFFLQKGVITLAAFINRQWSYYPPNYIFPIINILLIIFFWVKIKSTTNFSLVLASISFVFLTSIFVSQLALPGYYFVATSFLLFSLAFNKDA